ncbi:RNA-directed DNA polymerase from mobile element jockey [Elysia marginata]|uniref:RNA-directed DNA polymerase from mobile element jockey n=1 Tax=Elysia marginata TaxID=1093978 RepID=A0AAV4EEG5_9GAST|nr:RNA-directed DNA polymerase from mobile element jockey [Elysia marginata]
MDKCISDHKVLVFELPFSKPKLVKRTITCRKKNIDNRALSTDILRAAEDMKNDYNKNLVDTYNRKLKQLLDIHAPLRTRIVTDRPSAPWMTSHIKELKTERRRAERKWRSTNLCIHKEIYRDLNRKLKNAIETAKKYFYCHKIEDCVTSKALYNVANTLSGIGGSSSQGSIPKTIPADQLAERFGNFFIEKIANIRKPMDTASSPLPSFGYFEGDCMTMFEPVKKEDVMKIIKTSPPKSCCLDPIPTPLLVIHLEHLIEPITTMINQSLLSGIVPVPFKHALVLPLLKKPNSTPEELKNFRPVSNLPFLSKI